jgi:hypothetical protein
MSWSNKHTLTFNATFAFFYFHLESWSHMRWVDVKCSFKSQLFPETAFYAHKWNHQKLTERIICNIINFYIMPISSNYRTICL